MVLNTEKDALLKQLEEKEHDLARFKVPSPITLLDQHLMTFTLLLMAITNIISWMSTQENTKIMGVERPTVFYSWKKKELQKKRKICEG